jgi:hypothetical protein
MGFRAFSNVSGKYIPLRISYKSEQLQAGPMRREYDRSRKYDNVFYASSRSYLKLLFDFFTPPGKKM